ncbi:sugar kinase [Treponema sp.]|uniref:sugar kinase n=1 Tax=Treponema sp. TaxID=166 RepID=UPI00298DC7C4|nr:sugar kinase [Treponema sp.]MCR5613043.1 sugar kinase [Treponema sp.]
MKVVTMGELMLRLMPEGHHRFVQVNNFNAEFGGAEANVAVSLAQFGCDSYFVSKFPQNEIGQSAINSIRRFGVKTDFVLRGGDRLGIYFLEKGASQRGSLCIYDRKGSAFAESSVSDYDWEGIFKGAKWFHITGVTPALGKKTSALAIEACKAAKKAGCTISCDLNYRSKLWTKAQAKKTMSEIAKYVDVCIANEEDALNVFGIKTHKTNVDNGIIDKDAYVKTAELLAKNYGFKKVAITLRQSINADNNNWSALLYDGKEAVFSREYAIHIVERVGAGDAFAAALIFALMKQGEAKNADIDIDCATNGSDFYRTNQDVIEFASAAGCLKHSIEGDFNLVSEQEVLRLVTSGGTGRISR